MKHGKCSSVANLMRAGLVLLLLVTCQMLFAQTDQGSITGKVTDTSGAAIPGASVILNNVDTGLPLERKTDQAGVYTFAPIKIGNYSILVTNPGFAKLEQQKIHVDIQQHLEVNVSLKPGAVNETVTVTDAPSMLQTQDASTGQVIDTKTINATPLNGRNWVFVAQLTAGVDASNGSRGQGSGDFNANGQRAGKTTSFSTGSTIMPMSWNF